MPVLLIGFGIQGHFIAFTNSFDLDLDLFMWSGFVVFLGPFVQFPSAPSLPKQNNGVAPD